MKYFNPHSAHPDRAVQAWQILVGKAMNRQTVTYQDLSILMFEKDAAGVLAKILGNIAFFCIDHDLPALTTIVVSTTRGTPGDAIPIDPATIDREREEVYSRNWYDIYPPSAEEFAAARERRTTSKALT
jgi:hypothetical protein